MQKFNGIIRKSILSLGTVAALLPSHIAKSEVDDKVIEEELIFREKTPFLGAGYSYTGQNFKSDCMNVVSVPEDEITADVVFKFSELNEQTMNQIKTDTTLDEDFKYWFFSARAKFNQKTNETKKRTFKQVYVEFTIDTYYERLLTSGSSLTSDALNLIKKDNLNLFLRACGDHYVKSLGRKKKYLALLTYKVDESDSDSSFNANLHAEFSSFFSSMRSTTDFKFSEEIISKAKRSDLQIEVTALGVGLKDLDPEMFPQSLEDLTGTIRAAMTSFKNSKTGMITKVEVAPWTSNPKFLNEMYDRLIARGEGKEECRPAATGSDSTSPVSPNCQNSSNTISAIQLDNFMRNSGTFFRASAALDHINYLEQDYGTCQANFNRYRALENADRQYLFKNRFDLAQNVSSDQLNTEVFGEGHSEKLVTAIDSYLDNKNASGGNPYDCLDELDSFTKLLNTRRAKHCALIDLISQDLQTYSQYIEQYCPIQPMEIRRPVKE